GAKAPQMPERAIKAASWQNAPGVNPGNIAAMQDHFANHHAMSWRNAQSPGFVRASSPPILVQQLDVELPSAIFKQALLQGAAITQPFLEGGRGNLMPEPGIRLPFHGEGF